MLPVSLQNLSLGMEDMESPALAPLWELQDMPLLPSLEFTVDMLEQADISLTLLELFILPNVRLMLSLDILDMEDMAMVAMVLDMQVLVMVMVELSMVR